MNKTPADVIDAILIDWQDSDKSFEEEAKELGYSSIQALKTFFYRKKRFSQYFSARQAGRFAYMYGYSVDFLTKGEGALYEKSLPGAMAIIEDLKYSELKLTALVHIANAIIRNSSNPDAIATWDAICQHNVEQYRQSMQSLIDNSSGEFQPGTDMPILAQIACTKSKEEIYRDFGYLEANMISPVDL